MLGKPDLRRLPGLYGATILLGAFLVFQVQPILSKMILPWFGGSPGVWTTCMLFFQTLLFGGYAYAHLLSQLRLTRQLVVHLLLLAVALALLPITPDAACKPPSGAPPTVSILLLLSVHVGLPYFLLSATGPLVQAWFARAEPDRSPYRLYALSNAGSLAALISYPFVFEPALATTAQGRLWSIAFGAFAVLCSVSAISTWMRSRGGNDRASDHGQAASVPPPARIARGRTPARSASEGLDGTSLACASGLCETARRQQTCADAASGPVGIEKRDSTAVDSESAQTRPTGRQWLSWIVLPALASIMLLATTNHVCQDIAVSPVLWILPLSLYLLTFILCFDSDNWYSRRWCGLGAWCATLAVAALDRLERLPSLSLELGAYMAALFFVCMLCHGELVRRKPHPRYLTSFYLSCAAGGAIGGMLVALICPVVFSTYREMNLCVIAGYGLGAVAMVAAWFRTRPAAKPGWVLLVSGVIFYGLVVVVRSETGGLRGNVVEATRNFYGVLHVEDLPADGHPQGGRLLRYGRICHGAQFLNPAERATPTAYFAKSSGAGIVLERFRVGRGSLRVGVVGLGVGTLAAYGQSGDYFRFYEINPAVIDLAQRYFTFLQDCPAQIDTVLGDARLSLEREPSQQFSLLMLDAFSGDAIPAHLLTREAFEIYQQHVQPDGVIAVHISNRHVDLVPVVRGLAERFQWHMRLLRSAGEPENWVYPSHWVLLTRNAAFLEDSVVQAAGGGDPPSSTVVLWTDQYSNLFRLLK
jgi:hypothetical protein